MAEIGNVSVKFTASTGGLKSGVADAARSLEAFGRAAARSEQALGGEVSSAFAGEMERVTTQLQAGEIKATRFGAAITSGLSRASAAISKGVTGQLVVLDKQLQTGTISAQGFIQKLGETAGLSSERAVTAFTASVDAASEAMRDGVTTSGQFVESIVELSATAAGGGIERFQAQVDSVAGAMDRGLVSSGQFTESIVGLYQVAGAETLDKQTLSVGALMDQLSDGTVSIDQFRSSLTNVQTAFNMESIANYERGASSLIESLKKGQITEEEFKASIDSLNATLDALTVGQLQEELAAVEEQFGATSQAAAIFHARIANMQNAIDSVKANVAESAKTSNPFEGILSGMEKINGAAKLVGVEVPTVFTDVTESLSGFAAISSAIGNLVKGLGPRFAALAGPLGFWAGVAVALGGALYKVAEYFGLIEGAQRIYAGKSIKDWEEERRKIEERNAALATGARFQAQYGGRANEIRSEMEQVRTAMKYGGSMSQESGAAALEDLQRQLEQADPRLRKIRQASEGFSNDMKMAARATEEVSNAQADRALQKYRRGYRELLKSAGDMPEVTFKARVEGLAAAFDKEMKRARAFKDIADDIERIYAAAGDKNTAAVLNGTFRKYDQAQMVGAVKWDQIRVARMEGIKGLAEGLGLDMKEPEPEGFVLYTKRLRELNAVVTKSAEEEELLTKARSKALQGLVDARNKYLEGLPGSKESTGTNAERAILKLDEDMQRLKEARAFVNSPDAALSNQDRMVAMAAIAGREKNLMAEFMRQNESVVDMAAAGKEPSRKANSAALVNSSEGMATYFRILRGSDPISSKQLRETQESRIILKRIEENTKNAGLKAANL